MTDIESVNVMNLKPGDTIVITAERPLRPENAEHIKTLMEKKFPGHQCLVLEKGLSLEVLHPE